MKLLSNREGIIILSLLFSVNIGFTQESKILEGRLIINFSEFQGFYGLRDPLVENYQESINLMKKSSEEAEEIKAFNELYSILEEEGLLYKPCYFLKSGRNRIRVYFTEKDSKKIEQTDWINKNKKEKKHTFIEMEVKKLRREIYVCEQILQIDYRLLH
jgi:hypothetical protein